MLSSQFKIMFSKGKQSSYTELKGSGDNMKGFGSPNQGQAISNQDSAYQDSFRKNSNFQDKVCKNSGNQDIQSNESKRFTEIVENTRESSPMKRIMKPVDYIRDKDDLANKEDEKLGLTANEGRNRSYGTCRT